MALDLANVRYRIMALTPDGKMLYFDELVLSGFYEENDGELAGRLEASLKNVKLADGWIHRHVAPGRQVFLQANDGGGWKEVFRGKVYKWITSPDDDYIVDFTAYDSLYPLQQSKEHKYYRKGETAVSCIKGLASQWGIPLGRVDGPYTSLSKKLFRATRIGDIFADRLEEARKKGGGRYVIRSTKGKVEIVIEGSNKEVYVLNHNFVESSQDEKNIENLVTRVKIYGNEDDAGRSSVKATKDGNTQFGVLQDVIYSSSYDNLSDAKKAANEIIKESGSPKVRRPVSGPDIPWIRKGDLVKVAAGTIGKTGSDGKWEPEDCIVESVSHDIANMRMSLTLRG